MENRVEAIGAPLPPGTNSAGWGSISQPLRECGEIAVLRLANTLSEAIEQAEHQLFKDTTDALTQVERETLMNAADFARIRRSILVIDFMKHFQQRYVRACEQTPDSLSANIIDFDEKELRIVEHHVLDDSLEPGKIKEAIQNTSWKYLQTLLSQYRLLLGNPVLMLNDLPLGPRVIENAVTDAIRDQHGPHKAKQRLVLALCWGLSARINLFYRDLADHLCARDLSALDTPSEPAKSQTAPSVLAAPTALAISDETPPAASRAPITNSASEAPRAPAKLRGEDLEKTAPDSLAANDAARKEVARCLAGSTMPVTIQGFLTSHWRPLLARMHGQFGANSPAWQESVRTMDDLSWSLTEKSTRPECLRLIEGLPSLLKRLDMGMEVLGSSRESRDEFFIELAKRHAEVVRLSLEQLPAHQPESAPAEPHQAAAETAREVAKPEAKALAEGPAKPPQAKPQDLARPETREAKMQAQETETLAARMSSLTAGTWFEFQEPGEAPRELKLAWVSPHRGLFLLTNRQGQRALSLSANDLATLLSQGRARITPPLTQAPPSQAPEAALPLRKTA